MIDLRVAHDLNCPSAVVQLYVFKIIQVHTNFENVMILMNAEVTRIDNYH